MKKVLVSRVDGTKLFEIEAGIKDKTVMEILSRNGWSASIPHRVFHVASCGKERWYYSVNRGTWIGVPARVCGDAVHLVKNGKFRVGKKGKPISVSTKLLDFGVETVVYGDTMQECKEIMSSFVCSVRSNSVLV